LINEKNNAVIGGEGNGGIIYPERITDAIVWCSIVLTHLAKKKMTVSRFVSGILHEQNKLN
jgi:phosphomannomutase